MAQIWGIIETAKLVIFSIGRVISADSHSHIFTLSFVVGLCGIWDYHLL